ncbi:MAG: hypothetical protein FJW34_00220 [Acidobacteria bacterium]|nr:hypothetical protein [Acidobacteriota bacterium]
MREKVQFATNVPQVLAIDPRFPELEPVEGRYGDQVRVNLTDNRNRPHHMSIGQTRSGTFEMLLPTSPCSNPRGVASLLWRQTLGAGFAALLAAAATDLGKVLGGNFISLHINILKPITHKVKGRGLDMRKRLGHNRDA